MQLLLSTAYFPPLEYFVYLLRATEVMIDLFETYPRQTWRNRCRVLSGNGPVDLSVPVEKPMGNHTRTHQVTISQHYSWKKNHWRTIYSAYRNSPYFIFYADMVEELIMGATAEYLSELNQSVLTTLIKEMDLNIGFEYTQSFISEPGEFLDLRFCISPKERDRKGFAEPAFEPYYQVFDGKYAFLSNACIVDLLFNTGPDAKTYLETEAAKLSY